MYEEVRNAILRDDLTALGKLQVSLNEDYRGAAKISSVQLLSLLFDKDKALSRDFSAEIYVPQKDRGGNLGAKGKGKVCTAIRYEISYINRNYSNIVQCIL